jgi:hypothetical protein
MPKRYIVSWTPTKAVESACRKRGMRDGDGTSFWDWIEPDNCSEHREFTSFAAARTFARKVLPLDCFGEVTIERQKLVRDHDDLGNVFRRKSWQTDATWHVQPDDQRREDDPTYRAEAA